VDEEIEGGASEGERAEAEKFNRLVSEGKLTPAEIAEMELNNFQDQKVGVLGLGEENLALVKYLIAQKAKVVICDQKSREELGKYYRQMENLPVQFRLGPHYLDHLEDFATVFRTPGLPYLHPKIQEAKNSGVEISSQTKLFFSLCPCPIIGITGTKGKGTTTALIGEILKRKFQNPNVKFQTNSQSQTPKNIYVGGNIGHPPIEFLDKLTKTDLVVLELSSFQLQDLDRSPHLAVILDIKVDHLDYHRDEKEYVEAKRNIVKYQSPKDFAVINADYLTSIEFASSTLAKIYWFSRRKSVDLGTFLLNNELILRTEDNDYPIIKTEQIQLRGAHNLENIAAAITASFLAGADIEAIKSAVKDFRGLEHRLEFVREVGGVKFYNDSFSTTPETTIAAIQSFAEPLILLLGGSEKGADYQELGKVISQSRVKMIIPIGLTAKRIIKEITKSEIKIIEEIQSMSEAIKIAQKNARPGEVVLLSPASASFDRFQNYKERGKIFKTEVNKL
jgi:UDP-N-acetylmuramoylalanine--D-glutamate ligase